MIDALYDLKKEFGIKAKLQYLVSTANDLDTGYATPNFDYVVMNRLIFLPNNISRFKEFPIGGVLEAGIRFVIVDQRDLPNGFLPDIGMFFVLNNCRWNIKEIDPYEIEHSFIIKIIQEKQQPKYEVFNVSLVTSTTFNLGVTNDVQ